MVMLQLIYIPEGLRMFKRRLRVILSGIKRYKGSPQEIGKQIIEDCWKNKYFRTSTGHFREFWTRDFGICTESLLNLGYKKKVYSTLRYALKVFSRHNKVTTTITPYNYPFDFPTYSPDSLPFLVRSLRLLGNRDLIDQYKDFLNKEINRFYDIVLDKETGLVRKDRAFSSIKDHSMRKSALYDNIMAAMLDNDLKKIRILNNSLKNYNFKKNIRDNFWTGEYFLDDLSGKKYMAGDANTFPYYCGVFTSKVMIKSSMRKIEEEGLDKPFPLKYTKASRMDKQFFLTKLISANYEGNTNWIHLGLCYINVVSKVDRQKAGKYLREYTPLINRYRNFLEVFNNNRTPYQNPFYYCDEGMLWVADYLDAKTSFLSGES